MNVLLHLTFADLSEIAFHDPLTSWAKTSLPAVTCFDLDNHSDNMLIQYAVTLLESAEKIMIVISVDNRLNTENLSFGNLSKLINLVIRTKSKPVKLLLEGKFPLLEKMGKATMKSFIQINDKTQWEKEITQFFAGQPM